MEDKIVIYIDEDPDALATYGNMLSTMLGNEISVEALPPASTIEEMSRRFLNYGNGLVSVILDEQLDSRGEAEYLGKELADTYRKLDPTIPIYILTNDPGAIEDFYSPVEYVFSKDDLRCYDQKSATIATWIQRRIRNFVDLRDERDREYENLVTEMMTRTLSDSEEIRFLELKKWRNRAISIAESEEAKELKSRIDEQDEKLKRIEQLIGDMDVLPSADS